MKITVRKCGFTNKYFESDSEYLSHLKELRKEFRNRRRHDRKVKKLGDRCSSILKCNDFDELGKWLDGNLEDIIKTIHRIDDGRKRWKPGSSIKVQLEGMRFVERIATTHCAPRGRRTSGWGQTPLEYYPGWKGRINLTFTGNGYDFFESRMMSRMCIHTGSGGGGRSGLSYDVTLFTDDFTIMAQYPLMDRLMK